MLERLEQSARLREPRLDGRALRVLALLLLVALCGRFLISLPDTYQVRKADFPAYYFSGMLVSLGEDQQLYGTSFKSYTNLPVVSLLFAPMAKLEYETAWKLMWWTSLASFAGTFALLLFSVRLFFPPLTLPRVALAALIFLAFAPVMRRCLVLGQTTPFMVLLFATFYLLCSSGRLRAGGAVLGAICIVKIPPIGLLPLLALRRRWIVVGTALGVLAGGVALSWIVFGSELMQQYVDRVILDNLGRAHAAYNNRSLDGSLMRLLSDKGLTDWRPVDRPFWVSVVTWSAYGAIALLLYRRGRALVWPARSPERAAPDAGALAIELGLGMTLMLLVIPIVWVHYYLFLAVPLTLLPFWWQQRGLGWRWPAIALFAVGTWLASGFDVPLLVEVASQPAGLAQRLEHNTQTLGAVLLVGAFAAVLPALER